MKKHRSEYPIEIMARVLEVSRSGYYFWLKGELSERSKRHSMLAPHVEMAHIDSRKTYGSRRIAKDLKTKGFSVGRDQISRIRKELGLRCIQRKKFKATTNSNHDLPIAPNLLNQEFTTGAPGQVWGSDITYISTSEGWLYLAGVKDFHTKEVVGMAMGARMTQGLVIKALKNALKYRAPEAECIMHSDRGSQYCAIDYQKLVKKSGLRASMSRRGNCYDNSPTESLWGTLKMELVYHRKFETRMEAEAAIQEYIEVFYNRVRRHSVLGDVAPAVFATKYYSERRSA